MFSPAALKIVNVRIFIKHVTDYKVKYGYVDDCIRLDSKVLLNVLNKTMNMNTTP